MARSFGWGRLHGRDKGDDILDGNGGNNFIRGGRGNDIVNGNDGNDRLFGNRDDDVVDGGAGDDLVSGGSGNDIVRGGAGNDRVFGGRGDDEAIYSLADNVGSSDLYNGGRGEDTLTLQFTSEEWANDDLRSDIADYLQFLDTSPDSCSWNGASSSFSFSAFDLTASSFESLKVVVDGVEVDPYATNAPPVVEGPIVLPDVFEDDPRILLNFLQGASDSDGDNLTVTNVTSRYEDSNGNSGNFSLVYTPVDLEGNRSTFIYPQFMSDLEDGESAVITVSYDIEDGNGGSVAQTISVTIHGISDPAMAPLTSSGLSLSSGTSVPDFGVDQLTLTVPDSGAPAKDGSLFIEPEMVAFDDAGLPGGDDFTV